MTRLLMFALALLVCLLLALSQAGCAELSRTQAGCQLDPEGIFCSTRIPFPAIPPPPPLPAPSN